MGRSQFPLIGKLDSVGTYCEGAVSVGRFIGVLRGKGCYDVEVENVLTSQLHERKTGTDIARTMGRPRAKVNIKVTVNFLKLTVRGSQVSPIASSLSTLIIGIFCQQQIQANQKCPLYPVHVLLFFDCLSC